MSENHFDDDRCLRSAEAAKFLGLSKQTLANWRHQGKPPKFSKLGKRAIGYKVSDLKEFVEAGGVKPRRDK